MSWRWRFLLASLFLGIMAAVGAQKYWAYVSPSFGCFVMASPYRSFLDRAATLLGLVLAAVAFRGESEGEVQHVRRLSAVLALMLNLAALAVLLWASANAPGFRNS
jgi:hypothetical protein